MVRFLIFLVGMLTTNRPGGARTVPMWQGDPHGRAESAELHAEGPDDGGTWFHPAPPPPSPPQWPYRKAGRAPVQRDRVSGRRSPPPRIRGKLMWAAVLVVAGLVFRKVIAWAVLVALSAALHLFGISVRLPHIRLAWPWQTISAGTTTDTYIGPWVLQRIEGISRPALGTENFNFTFTHRVSKNIGIWPCWYSSAFAAVGHASATVNLNPGQAWWTRASGHYRLQVLSRPATGVPGRVSVTIVLPVPQLPQSVHDVTVDNTLSHPIDVQHSWTYPGLGCGALIQPQFSVSVLYGQAQNLAFAQVRQNPQITRPLISTTEAQAARIIRNDFVQPTVNALGYTLTGFTVHWSAAS